MGRIYSANSNYAVGQFARMVFFGLLGGYLTWLFLPRLVAFPQGPLVFVSVIVGGLCARIAKRYT